MATMQPHRLRPPPQGTHLMGEAFKYMSPGAFDLASGKQFPMSSPDPSDTFNFLATHHADIMRSGEHRLCYAVLVDALGCAISGPAQERHGLRAEARDWIASDDESWPFSFCAICAYLHIEPSAIRNAVAKLDASGKRKSVHRPHMAGLGQHTVNEDIIRDKRGRP